MSISLAPTFGVGYQGFTSGGLPLNAGLIYTYISGGTTPQATFTTAAGNVQNANPIVLNSDGRTPAEVWITDGVAYSFVLKDSNNNTIGTYPDITSVYSGTQIAFQQGGTGAGIRIVQAKEREVRSITDYYANGVSGALVDPTGVLDSYLGIQAALDAAFAAGGGWVYVPTGTYKCTVGLTAKAKCGLYGDGMKSSIISFSPVSTAVAIKLGAVPVVASGTVNKGMGLADMGILLNTANCTGVQIISGVNGAYENVDVSSATPNNGQTGWYIDGSNSSAYFNTLINCYADHCHTGYLFDSSGTTKPTANYLFNCSVLGDNNLGDTTGRGYDFSAAGDGNVTIGGNIERCATGIIIQASSPASSFYGQRFESNTTDLQLNSVVGGFVIIGSTTLSAAKTNDNSGVSTNTIQYGVAGTVGVSGQVVTKGFTTVNGAIDAVFTATASGAVAGTTNARYVKNGKDVTLTLEDFKPGGNSSATPITITGLPASIAPVNICTEIKLRVTDNGIYLNNPGMLRVNTDNTLTIFATGGGASFTSSTNSTGWDGFSTSWRTA